MIKDMARGLIEKAKDEDEYNKIILDNYKLKDGIYIRLHADRTVKIKEGNYIIIDNNENKNNSKDIILFKWFRERDYYSVLLNEDTNKAIDLPAKKILSTNWLTLFIKRDILPDIGKDKKMLSKGKLFDIIENYFEKLKRGEDRFIEIYTKSNYLDKKIGRKEREEFLQKYFRQEIENIRSNERNKKIENNKQYIMHNFDEIIEAVKELDKTQRFKGYVKIFFESCLNTYKNESRIYTLPRIFNTNDFNLFTENEIFGLPSSDITTNSKKPYLILKSMRCHVPCRTTLREAEISKNIFEWLVMQGKFKNIKLDYDYEFDGTNAHKENKSYYTVHLNKNGEIDEFDNVPFDTPVLKFNLENILRITERVDKKDKNSNRIEIADELIIDYFILQQKFNEYFFNNKLGTYLKEEPPKIESNKFTAQMSTLFIHSRDALSDFFSKGIDISISALIDRLTIDLIQERLIKTVQGFNLKVVAKAFNLRISLLKYFNKGGKYMADRIRTVMQELKSKILLEQLTTCKDDEEFYFTAGQLAYYMFSQSEAHKKTYGIFEPVLNTRDSNQLKKRLQEIFDIYKHAILVGNVRFKNAMSMVMGYETDENITDNMKNMLLAGLLADNIFYTKKEDKK
jgi:CRISPR-associated protein Csh1